MSTGPVQTSPLAAQLIALLQGPSAAAGLPATPPQRAPLPPMAAPAKIPPGPTVADLRSLPRGSLINIVA